MSYFRPLTFDRGFKTLFEDGVHLLMASERESNHEAADSLARGSIACTMMLPEVCANICIESLKLETSVFKEIDKLAPLAKCDFFLRTNFRNRKLESGQVAVQKAQELKRLRDAYVHPKKQAVAWVDTGDDTSEGTSERTQFLDMSKNPSMWNVLDAQRAMRGAHEYLGFFFSDLCKYSKARVTRMLFSDDPDLSQSTGGAYLYRMPFRSALVRWQVDTSYFHIGSL